MWDGIGLGQEGAAIYVGAASMCPEAQDDSCARRSPPGSEPRARPKGSVDKPAGGGWGRYRSTPALFLKSKVPSISH